MKQTVVFLFLGMTRPRRKTSVHSSLSPLSWREWFAGVARNRCFGTIVMYRTYHTILACFSRRCMNPVRCAVCVRLSFSLGPGSHAQHVFAHDIRSTYRFVYVEDQAPNMVTKGDIHRLEPAPMTPYQMVVRAQRQIACGMPDPNVATPGVSSSHRPGRNA